MRSTSPGKIWPLITAGSVIVETLLAVLARLLFVIAGALCLMQAVDAVDQGANILRMGRQGRGEEREEGQNGEKSLHHGSQASLRAEAMAQP